MEARPQAIDWAVVWGNGMVGVKLHADGGFFSDSSDGVFFDLDFSRFSFAAATSYVTVRALYVSV